MCILIFQIFVTLLWNGPLVPISFEYRCYRKLLNIPYNQHVCNSIVKERITESIGKHCDLLQTVKTRKLKWFGHVSRHQGLAKTILQGTLPGSRKKGRPRKKWFDNISEWTAMSMAHATRATENRDYWRSVVRSSSAPQQPPWWRLWERQGKARQLFVKI